MSGKVFRKEEGKNFFLFKLTVCKQPMSSSISSQKRNIDKREKTIYNHGKSNGNIKQQKLI